MLLFSKSICECLLWVNQSSTVTNSHMGTVFVFKTREVLPIL